MTRPSRPRSPISPYGAWTPDGGILPGWPCQGRGLVPGVGCSAPHAGHQPGIDASNGLSSANLKFTTVDIARNANYTLSTGVMTVAQPGLYLVSGYVRMSTAPAGAVRVHVTLNGGPTQINYIQNLIATPVSHQLVYAAGDQLAVTLVNSDGNAQTVAASNRGTTFFYLGPA